MSNTPINAMKQHGAFSWNELMTTDIEGAKSFYSALFNWQIEEAEGDMPYTMGTIDGQHVSGMMKIPAEVAGMPPMWGGYVTVDDVDASAKQAVTLGGKVFVEPTDIPNIGRFCVISDPQGAVINMISYVDQA